MSKASKWSKKRSATSHVTCTELQHRGFNIRLTWKVMVTQLLFSFSFQLDSTNADVSIFGLFSIQSVPLTYHAVIRLLFIDDKVPDLFYSLSDHRRHSL